MRVLYQCELNTVAAGANEKDSVLHPVQPQAGLKEDALSAAVQAVVYCVVTGVYTLIATLWGGGKEKKQEKENKDASYNSFSHVSF